MKSSSDRSERMAQQAAACQGVFASVQYPWLHVFNFEDDSYDIQHQKKSPFYFKGVHTASKRRAFLKVWREGDTKTSRKEIDNELHHLKSAQESGIPVANLVIPKITESQVEDAKFFTLATLYVDHDTSTVPPDDVLPFAASLVSAVDELHNKTGILHCDIKPENIRWDDVTKSIMLVDFGHAQLEDGARSYRSTEGFEAPEILEKRPHSRKTDAYAVGRTLLKVLAKSRELLPEHGVVKEVAEKLVADSPFDRWSLKEALTSLAEKQALPGNLPISDEEDSTTPPKKMARTSERIARGIDCAFKADKAAGISMNAAAPIK